MRATALGTESFYLVSHIVFKAFNYTHLHNMSHIFSHSLRGTLVNKKKEAKQSETYSYNKDQEIDVYFT